MNLGHITLNQALAIVLMISNMIMLGLIVFGHSDTTTRIIFGTMVVVNFLLVYQLWFSVNSKSLHFRIIGSVILCLAAIISGASFLGFL
ncbi:MAG: hypothetical protein GFH27_549331n9 [Chloroflexi bacterium AL-W]|nr:hypothetical protein [Chloroflexi bacterium AL-N1]NOK70310.1 hypothetical protein [Chloroflexi bacterium AL-N10]NOK77988.1 hypothetical protein [Chloroflexi bacterium AL-N5]NOK85087.1 hypothetical protein [Chloroflexi bacterium AL-W]